MAKELENEVILVEKPVSETDTIRFTKGYRGEVPYVDIRIWTKAQWSPTTRRMETLLNLTPTTKGIHIKQEILPDLVSVLLDGNAMLLSRP